MNWLYSLVLAGLMFTSDSELMPTSHPTYKSQSTSAIVKFDETERFEQTYPLNANGRVSVSNVNGSITVEAWDRNEVKLEAVKVADTKENLDDVEFRINARQDSFSVEADYDKVQNHSNGNWKNYRKLEVQFRLTVPRAAVLDEVETVNGSVTVSNFTNTTKVSAVNGEVRATNLRGTANLSTVNGTVDAVFDSLDAGSKISLETVNGRVNLMIPSDSNATIKAETLNGEIKNDFGLPVRKGEYVGKDLYGKIGSGDVQIRLNSVNGGLSIGRKSDGKNASQSVNLLTQSENYEKSGSSVNRPSNRQTIDTAKMNREIAKAVADSQRETARALKEAEKELKNLPAVAEITEQALKESAEAIEETNKMLNSPEFKRQMKENQKIQLENMTKLSDISWNFGTPRVEKKSETFTVNGTPKVTIDAKGCAVDVRGWDKAEVQYSVKKYSRSRNQTPLDVKAENSAAGVNINVVNAEKSAREGNFFDDDSNVRIEVYVPKKSNLRITTNGELRLEGVSGDIELNGVDESINVRDSSGKLRVKAGDGRIRIVGFNGELVADSVDGETYLEGTFEKITATTVDGTIILTVPSTADFNLESNVRNIEAENFNLQELTDRENVSRWKIGKGGALYLLNSSADGKISLRSKNILAALE